MLMRRLQLVFGAVLLLACRDSGSVREGYGSEETTSDNVGSVERFAERSREAAEHRADRTDERGETSPEPAGAVEPETSSANVETPGDARARAQLEALMGHECEGVQEAAQTTCPIEAGQVRGVREIEGGIAVRLDARPSDEMDLEKRTDCYLAHAVVRRSGAPSAWEQGEFGTGRYGPGSSASYGADGSDDAPVATDSRDESTATDTSVQDAQALQQAPAFCLIDSPDIEVDVEDNDGRIELEIVTDDAAKLAQLRERAETMREERARAPRPAERSAQRTPSPSTP
jgi:hypothetical protein